MLLNLQMVMHEPWKASALEVYLLRTTDGSVPRGLDPNTNHIQRQAGRHVIFITHLGLPRGRRRRRRTRRRRLGLRVPPRLAGCVDGGEGPVVLELKYSGCEFEIPAKTLSNT